MALTHLIDTSVLTRVANPAIRAAVQQLADAGALGRSSISDLELGYSARNAREWDELVRALDVLTLIEITAEHFDRAKQVQRQLAAQSQRGRKIPDLLIAAAAESKRLTVLHYDRDFEAIAAVTGQPTEWAVEPGSID